jgi:alpha-N-arabinofuranosidase
VSGNKQRSFGEISKEAKEKIKNVPDKEATEKNFLDKESFDADAKLITEGEKIYLEIALDKNWLTEQKRELVTTASLSKAIIPNLPFENVDGTPLKIDVDYSGNKRNAANPSPGPFEILKTGKQK